MSIAVSLLLTALLLLLAFASFAYFAREFKRVVSVQQFTLISAMAEEIDSKLQISQKELVAVAATAPSDLASDRRKAQSFLDGQPAIRTVFDSGIFIFSTKGILVAASPPEPTLQGRDYSYREYIKETLSSRRPFISAPFYSTQSHHHPIVMFTAPFFDAEGKMTGIMGGALDLLRDNYLGNLARIRMGQKGYLYLYSTDRTIIVHPDRSRILRNDVPVGVNRLFDLAIKGFEGTDETVNSRGLHAVSSFKHLKNTNWILAANFPQTEVYAPVDRAKKYLIAALAVILILANVIVWWVMGKLTAPLQHFTEHFRGGAARGEDAKPVAVTTSDEIGTLGHAFNAIVEETNRQKAVIREQKEFSDNLLLNSAVPTFILDNSHRVIVWNKACEELSGIKAEDVLGSTQAWMAFYREEHPVLADFIIDGRLDDHAEEYVSCRKSPYTSDGLQAEGWRRMPDGSDRYLFFDAVAVRNSAGSIVAVIQTVQDITERIVSRRDLELKNIILSTEQETSLDGILLVDENNRISSYNRRFAELWDIPLGMLEEGDDGPVVRHVAEKVADVNAFLERVEHLYRQREEKSNDEILLADGRVLDRYSSPIRSSDGRYFGRVWYFRDITDRKQIEEALRESEARYRQLVEHLPDGIFIHQGGRLVFANSAGTLLLGADNPEDLFGKMALDFVHSSHRETALARIENATADADQPLVEELLVRLDGSTVPVEMVCVHFDHGGEDSVLSIARDISDRKRMQDEIIKAQKLESLGVLAGGIAHDFNNILTGILGNLSLAIARLDASHPVAKYLQSCKAAAVRATSLTKQILTFARGGEPVKKIIDLQPLIDEASHFSLRGSNVKARLDIAENLWSVEADSGQINQVLQNVLINAAQAMPDGGEVVVRAFNETSAAAVQGQLSSVHYVSLEIEDKGCGIAPEHIGRIFDPYFTTKANGSGLGLASVYSIIKRHGGDVHVDSEAGRGCRFMIRLPARPHEKFGSLKPLNRSELSGSCRVLVMDDEQIIRDIVMEILQFAGYDIQCCCNGDEAVSFYREAMERKQPFAAAILDLTIPGGMGGKDAASRILAMDPTAQLIVSSGYSRDPVMADFSRYGFKGVVAKPFDVQELVEAIEKLVAKEDGQHL